MWGRHRTNSNGKRRRCLYLCALCGGAFSTCSHLCQGHTKSKLESWNASHSVHRPFSSVSITCHAQATFALEEAILQKHRFSQGFPCNPCSCIGAAFFTNCALQACELPLAWASAHDTAMARHRWQSIRTRMRLCDCQRCVGVDWPHRQASPSKQLQGIAPPERTSMRAKSSLTQPLMDFGNAFTALHRSTCARDCAPGMAIHINHHISTALGTVPISKSL